MMASCLTASAQPVWLDKLDDSLQLQSKSGAVKGEVSGLLDLEGHYHDGNPPGLLFPEDKFFFNPRLSLFLDARVGEHLYLFVQGRVDRGFDTGLTREGDARADEYFIRYTADSKGALNLQAGKFATVFGNYVRRHDSWQNPFITAPLVYENVTIMSDSVVPPTAAGLLARRGTPDKKGSWLPVIWGPSYASGASISGQVEKFDYALELKNAGLSSRPTAWSATDLGWDYPTVSSRLGFKPNATWQFGASFSRGAFYLPSAYTAGLAPFGEPGDFPQTSLGLDLTYAWRHWQLWSELVASRFESPAVGGADSLSWYVEGKYKITTRWFTALRWNQQMFGEVPDGAGGRTAWDRDIWRIDSALGYRWGRHWQAKAQYSFKEQNGSSQQGQHLVALQTTVRF